MMNAEGEFTELDIHELIDSYETLQPCDRIGAGKKIRAWLMEQGITESSQVELSLKDMHFLASFLGFQNKLTQIQRGVRGPILLYGCDKMEFFFQKKSFDVAIHHYSEHPKSDGPIYYLQNIVLSKESDDWLRRKCGITYWVFD